MDEVVEWVAARKLEELGKISLRVSAEMASDIDTLCKECNLDPSEFVRRCVRREVNRGNVELFKKKKSTTKLDNWITVKKWEKRFPRNQKIIRAILEARIKEEKKKLAVSC